VARRSLAGRDTSEWEVYLRFSRHALAELERGTLDPWFLPPEGGGRDKP
jgi:hypothetical protein